MTRREASKLVGKSVQTIKNWQKEGLSLESTPEEILRWSKSKDSHSRGFSRTLALLKSGPQLTPASILAGLPEGQTDGELGAAAALQRLSVAERDAHRYYKAVEHCGDPLAASEARTAWMQISNALRQYDLAVERDRREAGELIPLGQAVEAARSTAEWLKLSIQSWLSSETPQLVSIGDPLKFVGAARQGISSHVKLTLEKSFRSRSPVPEWAQAAVNSVFVS
jgi:hypothetical protein